MNQIPACAMAVFLGLATPAVANAGLYNTAVADVDHSRKSDRFSVTTVSVGSIDVSDTPILSGDRSGRLRFRTDRVIRTNIVLEKATFPKPTPLETIDVPARGKGFRSRRANSRAAGRLRGARELDCRSDFGPARRSLLCIGRAGTPYLNERKVDPPKQRRTSIDMRESPNDDPDDAQDRHVQAALFHERDRQGSTVRNVHGRHR